MKLRYDAAGNRISRVLVLNASAVPESQGEEVHSELLGENTIKIYPNPTQGRVKVEVKNGGEDVNFTFDVFNSSGKQLISKSGIAGNTEFDLTGHQEGIYILQIMIGDDLTEWKILKR